jgi:hypothetical protein
LEEGVMRWSRARAASCLLALILPGQDVETIIGDLEEEDASRPPSRSGSPRWWYWAQIMRSLPVFLWLPIQRSGWPSTVGVALAACAIQAAVEVTTGFAAHELSPPEAKWPGVLTLAVTLPSLTLLSYQATRLRSGAATALPAVALLAIVVQLLLGAKAGRVMPLGTLAALVVGPSVAFTGGFLALKRRQR